MAAHLVKTINANSKLGFGRINSAVIRKVLVFIICYLLCTHFLFAQKNTNQVWLEYRPTYIFSPKFKIDGRVSFRDEFDATNWHTWEARVIPVYKLSKGFDVNLGLSFLETSQSLRLTTLQFRLAPVCTLPSSLGKD